MRKLILLIGLTFIVTISNSQTLIDKEVILQWNDENTNWITSDTYSHILTSGQIGSAYPFQTRGNLVLQPRAHSETDIVFGTGATPTVRMVIKGNGNVGIGTTSPIYKLEVHGSVLFKDASSVNGFYFAGGTGASRYLNIYDDSGNSKIILRPEGNTYFNGGNVGIGTINPYKSLDVVGVGSFGDAGGAGALGIEIGQVLSSVPSSQIRAIIGISDSDIGTRGDLIFQPRSNVSASTRFFIAGNEKMRIHSNGNIGIGTSSPDYKLDVIGTIRAQEIKVDLEGADFVFENNYKLQSLEEVENFVKENKHLPDIEPASKMEENGTELGELNSKLLQKIEELTLYMIEQNKKTENLIEKVDKLESENELLKNEINNLKTQ